MSSRRSRRSRPDCRDRSDYLEVPTGEREVAVNVAGTDQTVFGPVAVELAAEDYTALARGEVTSDDSVFTRRAFEILFHPVPIRSHASRLSSDWESTRLKIELSPVQIREVACY